MCGRVCCCESGKLWKVFEWSWARRRLTREGCYRAIRRVRVVDWGMSDVWGECVEDVYRNIRRRICDGKLWVFECYVCGDNGKMGYGWSYGIVWIVSSRVRKRSRCYLCLWWSFGDDLKGIVGYWECVWWCVGKFE